MAYAAADAKDVSIRVNNLTSKPYIDLTLDVMRRFGLKLPENKNYEEFYFSEETHNSSLITHEYYCRRRLERRCISYWWLVQLQALSQ